MAKQCDSYECLPGWMPPLLVDFTSRSASITLPHSLLYTYVQCKCCTDHTCSLIHNHCATQTSVSVGFTLARFKLGPQSCSTCHLTRPCESKLGLIHFLPAVFGFRYDQTGNIFLLGDTDFDCLPSVRLSAEHSDRERWRCEAVRLWICPGDVLQHHGADQHQGDSPVHGTGAGAGTAIQPHREWEGGNSRKLRPLCVDRWCKMGCT